MATRGRKPTPTAVKELEGNPGKRPLNAKEPKPAKKAPSCPKWLEPEAKKEWRRLAKQMEQNRHPDGSRYGRFCRILSGVCPVERGGGIHHAAWLYRKDSFWVLAAGAAGKHCPDLSENHEPLCRTVWSDAFLPEPDHRGYRQPGWCSG